MAWYCDRCERSVGKDEVGLHGRFAYHNIPDCQKPMRVVLTPQPGAREGRGVMSDEVNDPQPTNEARLLDASELHEMGHRIDAAYQAFRNDEEGWASGLIAVTEDIAPTLHDALLLTRAALAASEAARRQAVEESAVRGACLRALRARLPQPTLDDLCDWQRERIDAALALPMAGDEKMPTDAELAAMLSDQGALGVSQADCTRVVHALIDERRARRRAEARIETLVATVDRWREDCDGEYRNRVAAEERTEAMRAAIELAIELAITWRDARLSAERFVRTEFSEYMYQGAARTERALLTHISEHIRDLRGALSASTPSRPEPPADGLHEQIKAWLLQANDDLNHMKPRGIRDSDRYFSAKDAIGKAVRALAAPVAEGDGE